MPGADRNKTYLAMIGDLVGSRKMEQKKRAQVQQTFQAALDKVNEDFKDEIASLFLITLGDETQGILRRPDHCFEILRQIQIELAPTQIVFGLGFGRMSTELGEYAVGSDGPALHLARQALTEAKAERKAYGKAILRDVSLQSENSFRDMIVNGLFLSLSVLRDGWTDKQARILNRLQLGHTPTETANLLDIPLSSVSRTVETARFREFEILENGLQQLFRTYFSRLSKLNV